MIRSGSMCPLPMLSCRSAPESNVSRESLAWTRSTRAGDRLDPVHDAEQLLAAGVGVAGVEAEARAVLADRRPTAGPDASKRRAMALSPPAVFSIRIGSGKPPLSWRVRERLAPVLVAGVHLATLVDVAAVHDEALGADVRRRLRVLQQQLAAGDPDAVVGGRDVEPVRRVDVDVKIRGPDGVRMRMRLGRGVALRVGEEELDHLGPARRRGGQRVPGVDVSADADLHTREPTTPTARVSVSGARGPAAGPLLGAGVARWQEARPAPDPSAHPGSRQTWEIEWNAPRVAVVCVCSPSSSAFRFVALGPWAYAATSAPEVPTISFTATGTVPLVCGTRPNVTNLVIKHGTRVIIANRTGVAATVDIGRRRAADARGRHRGAGPAQTGPARPADDPRLCRRVGDREGGGATYSPARR